MHRTRWSLPRRKLVTLLLVAATALLWSSSFRRLVSDDAAERVAPPTAQFQDWPKPTLALFITGQQHGYIEPCGCAGLENQKGGLARRDQLLHQLEQDRGWRVAALDVGNQVRRSGPQAWIKYQATLRALRTMQYQVVGLGEDDLKLSSVDLLSEIIAQTDNENKSDLFVSANVNLLDSVPTYRVISDQGIRVGVTTFLGNQETKSLPKSDELQVSDAASSLASVVAKLKREQCNFVVVLGNAADAECRQVAANTPGVNLMVCADGVGEPKYQPDQIKRADGSVCALIQTGAKGMYVGVIGLYFGNQPTFRYQRVALDASLPDSKRMMDSLKQYQLTLEDVLRQQGAAQLGIKPVRHPKGNFVGSETCGECHTRAYAKWQETPHAHATQTIAQPSQRAEVVRHFDPECVSCHVTGWNPQSFYPYESGYDILTQPAHLQGSGCENCHGPGEAHVKAEQGTANDDQRLNLRKQMRLELQQAHDKCLECHDIDNSPKFHEKETSFTEYWERIKHPGRD